MLSCDTEKLHLGERNSVLRTEETIVETRYSNQDSLIKICGRCGSTKNLNFFHRNRSKPLGVDSICKDCVCRMRRDKRARARRKVARLEDWRHKFRRNLIGSPSEEIADEFARVLATGIGGLIERGKL